MFTRRLISSRTQESKLCSLLCTSSPSERLERLSPASLPARFCAITPSTARLPNENYHFACQRLCSRFCRLSPCRCASGGGGSGRRGVPTHVEHHSHRTVVSAGAGESLSSAPTGVEPAAENWDLTVRAVTSCFAHLLLLPPRPSSSCFFLLTPRSKTASLSFSASCKDEAGCLATRHLWSYWI